MSVVLQELSADTKDDELPWNPFLHRHSMRNKGSRIDSKENAIFFTCEYEKQRETEMFTFSFFQGKTKIELKSIQIFTLQKNLTLIILMFLQKFSSNLKTLFHP